MLTTNDLMDLDDYIYKSSPESCFSNTSTEDFLQQLYVDLDIPLLLSQDEDQKNLLGSQYDQSPNEIMSDIYLSSPQSESLDSNEDFNGFDSVISPETFSLLASNIKHEATSESSCNSSDSNKSNSPIHSPVDLADLKEELKLEALSPCPQITIAPTHQNVIISTAHSKPSAVTTAKFSKIIPKQVPIQPKNVPNSNKNMVLIKGREYKFSPNILSSKIRNPAASKVVVLENVAAVPITTTSSATMSPLSPMNNITNTTQPMIISSHQSNHLPLVGNNVDPRIIKRQQRKIKNRESACLSRKKKKDYLTSLETQVKILSKENQTLKAQNVQLKERLSLYEGNNFMAPKLSKNGVKNTIMLCMFLFSLGFNLDYFRNPAVSIDVVDSPEIPKQLDHHGRSLLWSIEEPSPENTTTFLPLSMCPAAVNQTESARLVLELERWIGKPNFMNETTTNSTQAVNVNVKKQKSKPPRRKRVKNQENSMVSPMYMTHHLPKSDTNELQVFSMNPEQMYSEFFEAINRQEDTFYVVSLSHHHMLLPALSHNKTRRPKMSLIMPSMLSDGNVSNPTWMPLMQIDCEVLDTRLIQIGRGHLHNTEDFRATEIFICNKSQFEL